MHCLIYTMSWMDHFVKWEKHINNTTRYLIGKCYTRIGSKHIRIMNNPLHENFDSLNTSRYDPFVNWTHAHTNIDEPFYVKDDMLIYHYLFTNLISTFCLATHNECPNNFILLFLPWIIEEVASCNRTDEANTSTNKFPR